MQEQLLKEPELRKPLSANFSVRQRSQTINASPGHRICMTARKDSPKPQNTLSPSPQQKPITFQDKPYRLTNYDTDVGLRSTIATTLAPGQSKIYREIRQLNAYLNPQHTKELEKMLEKLCIKTPRRKKMHWAENVNADTIETMYVKSKSRDKGEEKKLRIMKSQIAKASHSKETPKKQMFFQFTSDRIRKFEENSPKKMTMTRGSSFSQPRTHPIVEIFDHEFQDISQQYQHGTLDVNIDLYDSNFHNPKMDQPDLRSQKLRRLRNLKSLKARIDFIAKMKKKTKVKQPFYENLS